MEMPGLVNGPLKTNRIIKAEYFGHRASPCELMLKTDNQRIGSAYSTALEKKQNASANTSSLANTSSKIQSKLSMHSLLNPTTPSSKEFHKKISDDKHFRTLSSFSCTTATTVTVSSSRSRSEPLQPPVLRKVSAASFDSRNYSISSDSSVFEVATNSQGKLNASNPNAKQNKPRQRHRPQCSVPDCRYIARSRGLCKGHGGGRRCTIPKCTRGSQGASGLCIAHGGGYKCNMPGCTTAVQSRGLCKAHGGGSICAINGCRKGSQLGGYCRRHEKYIYSLHQPA